MPLIADCLKEIESMRRECRGKPDKFRLAYQRRTAAMLDQFMQMPPEERALVLDSVSKEESGLLFGICRSAATSSVEEHDAERLRWGLLALVVENRTHDYRATLIELTLLDNSAKKLGVDLETYFESFKNYASEQVRDLFDTYFREGHRRISAMRYVEAVDKSGRFTYKQAW